MELIEKGELKSVAPPESIAAPAPAPPAAKKRTDKQEHARGLTLTRRACAKAECSHGRGEDRAQQCA